METRRVEKAERLGTLKNDKVLEGGKSRKTRYPENDKVLQDKAHSHSLALTQAHLFSSVEKLREIGG